MRQSLFHCYAPTVHNRIVYVYCYYQTLTVWLGGIGDFFQPLIGERSLSIAIDVVFVDHLTKLNALLNKTPNVTKNRYVRRWNFLSGAPFLYSPKRLLTSSPTEMTRSSSSSRSRRKPDFLTLRKEAPGR